MKKILLFIFLFYVSISFAYSQVRFGLKAGASVTRLYFADMPRNDLYAGDFRSKLFYHAGFIAEVNINDKLYVKPELLYSVKGSDYPLSKNNIRLNYLNVPVLLGYRVNAKLSAYFGAEPGFLLKIKANRFTSERIGNDSKKWDMGLDVGTTYNLTPKWMIDVRYNYGIKTVAWKSYPLESNYDGISKNGFNRGLQLALSCFILD